MQYWDQRFALFGLGLGILVIILSLRLEIGTWNHPGPGFMPLGSGILLMILSGIYAAWSTWWNSGEYLGRKSPWPEEGWGRIVGVLVTLVLYTVFVNYLGYILTTFFLLAFLFRMIEPRGWLLTIAQAALTVLVTYIVFQKWLMVEFPRGFWGF